MMDPRFANAGGVPFVPGYGAQQGPAQYYHHRHHHHKHKNRNDESPVSRDESIHKVDYSQPHQFQNDGVTLGGGYGVPYGTAAGFYSQQQQFGGGNFGYANQYQGAFGGNPAGQTARHHRRHHRHHRHQTVEGVDASAAAAADPSQAVPEQLIGQRSSSVLGKEQLQEHSSPPAAATVAEGEGGQAVHRRHHRRHHRHHHSGEQQAGFGEAHQSRHAQYHSGEQPAAFEQTHQTHYHTTAGANGYGHINEELIFIERGEHSPHRQEPPPGYEYKGKIEVQGLEKEYRTKQQSYAPGPVLPPPVAPPAPQTVVAPFTLPVALGPCPYGMVEATLNPGGKFPCPGGGVQYVGQLNRIIPTASLGVGGYGSGSEYASWGAGASLPPNCQIVSDYVVGSGSAGVISTGSTGYQQTIDTGYTGQYQGQQTEEYTSTRPTIIEVWQKRGKTEIREKSHSRSPERTRTPIGPDFDFERFRSEILAAIERIMARAGPAETQGTQTQIHPTTTGETRIIETRHEAGEVRVIVQPIQPVFYMPRQTATVTPQVGPVPIAPQPTPSAPNVIYVPRNVYVPVIKPVFVPRERVIVRPQVIHVARPVLVDRPVPVTQRPIIIDRERPIPVPVRGGAAQTVGGGSKIVKEEFVYRDNLPVAYGGRCAEFTGGANYGYVPTQQAHQYASSSTHESSIYQGEAQAVNVGQFNEQVLQQTYGQSAAQIGGAQAVNVGQFNEQVLQQTYGQSGAQIGEAQAVNVGQFNEQVLQQSYEQSAQIGVASGNGSAPIEFLDAAIDPLHWQKTEEATLIRRYGRPAYEIVTKSKEVEQQMYNELRQRSSSGVDVRSTSTVSYASGSGIGVSDGGLGQF